LKKSELSFSGIDSAVSVGLKEMDGDADGADGVTDAAGDETMISY
jgi:hypothetical protein